MAQYHSTGISGDHARQMSVASGRVGPTLRAERDAQGMSLDQVAAGVRIRGKFLEAIETENWGELPAPTYAVGFVKGYADFLGLDADEMVRRLRIEMGDAVDQRLVLVFPSPAPEGRVPGLRAIALSVALMLLVFAGWWWVHDDLGRVEVRIPEIPERLAALAPANSQAQTPAPPVNRRPVAGVGNAALPPPPGDQARGVRPALVPMPPNANASAGRTNPDDEATPAPTAIDDAAPAIVSLPEVAPAQTPEPPQIAALPMTDGRLFGPSANARVLIRAKADSWVQVRDGEGQILFVRLMRSGDAYRVPVRGVLWLNTGNAGGLEVQVDGQAVPALGGNGIVKRNVLLDIDRLKAGTAAPQAPSAE